MRQHTPGPWKAFGGVYTEDETACVSIFGSGNAEKRPGRAQGDDNEQAEANAQLIAAAPELLEALVSIVNDAEPGEDAQLTVAGYNQACAAIARATAGRAQP